MNANQINELKQVLKQHQLQPTTQRLVILQSLRSTTSHPTADEVKKIAEEQLPMVSTATVYNVLNQLEKCGLIKSFRLKSSTAQRFDGNIAPHHHLFDEDSHELIDIPLEKLNLNINVVDGYDISGAELILRGRKKKA